jgi:hypothetical protein
MGKEGIKRKRMESQEAEEALKKLRKSVVSSILAGDSPLKAAKWFPENETTMVMTAEEQC